MITQFKVGEHQMKLVMQMYDMGFNKDIFIKNYIILSHANWIDHAALDILMD
jgi:hypothetical protein